MKPTGNFNINTRTYWNHQYLNDTKRDSYKNNTGISSPATMSNRFLEALSNIKDGDKVLDIGCGVGTFTELVFSNRNNCEVWGVDISDAVIKDNEKTTKGVRYIHQYIGNLNKVPNLHFDVVFSGEVLEHLNDPNVLFRDAWEKLDEGGCFIMTTPLEDHIKSTEHTFFFDKNDIIKLYKDNGFHEPFFTTLPGIEGKLVIFAVGHKL